MLDPAIGQKAKICIERMLEFTRARANPASGLVPRIGAA
jgi:hypothetical protein